MTGRWSYLLATTLGRAVVGFQFQALPALAPALGLGLGLSLSDIGLLTGLYMAPGVIMAVIAGVLLQTYSVRTLLIAALLLMTAGAALATLSPGFLSLAAARVVQGVGGVLMIVSTLKGVYDRFDATELAMANAISGAAHPFGMGLALMLFTALGATVGWRIGFAASGLAAFAALLAIFVAVRNDRPSATNAQPARLSQAFRFPRHEARMLLWASCIVALYAGNFHAFLSFLPSYLRATGWSPGQGATIMALLGWAPIIIAPAGGMMIARFGHASALIALCLLVWGGSAVAMALIGVSPPLVLLMLLFGPLVLGAVMSLGAQAVSPERRGVGSGLFMAGFFLGNAALPALSARFGEAWPDLAGGAAATAILFCGIAFLGALLPLGLFERAKRAAPADQL